MNVRLEASFENIGKEKWNVLVSQSATNTIFQTYEWNYAWWKTYGMDKELFIVCVEYENNLIGIAPLMICRGNKDKKILRFIGHGRSDYSDFFYTDRKVLEPIFEFIKSQSSKWEEIELNRIPGYSTTSVLIRSVCKDQILYCLKDRTTLWSTLDIRKDPDFAQKIQNKKKLIQYKNYFLKKGAYKTTHITDKHEMIQHLEHFFQQHIERWRATETQSLFMEQENRNFYKELVLNMADNGWIIFTVVESNGMPIAFHFGFMYNNKIIFYKPSFEISLAKYSPGQVLLKELFDYAMVNNLDEFDFTVGDEAYKRRFSNKTGENISYRVFRKYRIYLIYKTMNIIKEKMKKYKLGNSIITFVKEKGGITPGI